MVRIGYALSSEEYPPAELIRQARLAEEAGFDALWISDHFHPWIDAQGQSPFVWSVIGALSQVTQLPVTTSVTCPTVRTHPAVIAQAAATSAVLLGGGFVLGVGSGEALNEHVLGGHWPAADARLAMLEEAVEVMRLLWRGKDVTFRGAHYTVENARIYTLPDAPPSVYISAFGPKSLRLAGRIADGYISTRPDAEALTTFRSNGGAGKPAQGGMKGCWARTADEARRTAHRYWPTSGLPGELAQILPTPRHFEQAASLVTPEKIGEEMPCGPDPELFVRALREYLDAGFDEVYVQQIGPDQEGFFANVAPELVRAAHAHAVPAGALTPGTSRLVVAHEHNDVGS